MATGVRGARVGCAGEYPQNVGPVPCAAGTVENPQKVGPVDGGTKDWENPQNVGPAGRGIATWENPQNSSPDGGAARSARGVGVEFGN